MSAPRVEPTVESIEHLDFAPPCQCTFMSCSGTNTATYLAVIRLHCLNEILICSECVARKAVMRGTWRCTLCGLGGLAEGLGWLDFTTLHPLKALR